MLMWSHDFIIIYKYGGSEKSRWFMVEDVMLVNKDYSMIDCEKFYEVMILL